MKCLSLVCFLNSSTRPLIKHKPMVSIKKYIQIPCVGFFRLIENEASGLQILLRMNLLIFDIYSATQRKSKPDVRLMFLTNNKTHKNKMKAEEGTIQARQQRNTLNVCTHVVCTERNVIYLRVISLCQFK